MNLEYKKRIQMALDHIRANLDQKLSLEELAGKSHFSKFHFHRLFKACTGETVSSHIRRLRLEKAANLLLADSGESITAIALDCGFGSSQNFATAFKRQFEISPGTFRDQYSTESWATKRMKKKEASKAGLNRPFDGSSRDGKTNLWVNLMDLPTYHVAYERVTGPYGHVQADKIFKKLFKWAGERCPMDASIALGIIWDNPEVTEPGKCRYDACVTVPDHVASSGGVGVQDIRGGRHLVAHCEVADYGELEQAYENVFSRWFPSSDYIPADSAAYEVYLNNPANHPRECLLVDICIPVKGI